MKKFAFKYTRKKDKNGNSVNFKDKFVGGKYKGVDGTKDIDPATITEGTLAEDFDFDSLVGDCFNRPKPAVENKGPKF